MRRPHRALLAVMLAMTLSACGSKPTYINIPPEGMDLAFSNPNASDVLQIEVVAIQRSLQVEAMGGPYVVVLPEGSTPESYAVVTRGLGPDAHRPANVPYVADAETIKAMQQANQGTASEGLPPTVITDPHPVDVSGMPMVTVKSIRVRSDKGQVDLVRPSMSGRRLTTVYMDWEAGYGWAADRVRSWRVDPDAEPVPVGPGQPLVDPPTLDKDTPAESK